MTANLVHNFPDGNVTEHKIPKITPAEWKIKINPNEISGSHKLIVQIKGKRPDGKLVDSFLKEKIIMVGTSDENKPIEKNPNESEQSMKVKVNWLMVVLRVLTFNILLAAMAFALYKFWPVIRDKFIPKPGKELVHG